MAYLARLYDIAMVDDLLLVAPEFMNPRLSRSGLHLLRRHEVSTLAELLWQDVSGSETPWHKPFTILGHQASTPDVDGQKFTDVDKFAKDARRFIMRLVKQAPSRSDTGRQRQVLHRLLIQTG